MPKLNQPTNIMSYSKPPTQGRGMYQQTPGQKDAKDAGKFDGKLTGRSGSSSGSSTKSY